MPDVVSTKVRDGLFHVLFQEPQFKEELCRRLLNDNSIIYSDIEDVTLDASLSDRIRNDLGLLVRDKLLVLVEAQTTYPANIALRQLLYFAETIKQYCDKHKLNRYSKAQLKPPTPHLYVVYTGVDSNKVYTERKDFRLSELFVNGAGSVNVNVQLLLLPDKYEADFLSGSAKDDFILLGYMLFSKQYARMKEGGASNNEAFYRAMESCRNHSSIYQFLRSNEMEVVSMMEALFSEKRMLEMFEAEGAAKTRRRTSE